MGEYVETPLGFVVESSITEIRQGLTSQQGLTSSTAGIERNLTEVLAGVVGVERVSADSNFFDDLGADSMVMAQFCARVRKRSELPDVSMKDIYEHPTIRELVTALVTPAPAPVEGKLAEVLAGVVGVERVSVDSNFFDDLGADSMVMARFCAKVRKQEDTPSVSMQDVYAYPTVRQLAAALGEPANAPATPRADAPSHEVATASTFEYVRCGVIQLIILLGYIYLAAFVLEQTFEWISAGASLLEIYRRSVEVGVIAFVSLCILPILAKWLIIGRWKPRQIRIWSLGYLRFWIVKTLVRSNPLLLFAGGGSRTSATSPLYTLYLRALGAKIGRGVVILSRNVPVCTDLLTIGDGTVIRKDSFFNCYRAYAGLIQTGPVTLGKEVVVGEATVIDIGVSMGDGSQLGHSSSLHTEQAVPAGERWHGSPAQRTEVDYRVAPAGCTTLRRATYGALQLLVALLVGLPLVFGGIAVVLLEFPKLAVLLESRALAFTSTIFYVDALIGASVLFFGLLLVGFVLVATVPRLLSAAIRPGRVYRLYGVHYWIHHTVTQLTNVRYFTILFGDSSYVVSYLLRIGCKMPHVEQTGSNFGLDVRYESPFLSSVGSGTMAADGLSIMNVDYSNTSFRVSPTSIGAHNFVGNKVAYPSQGRTGDNCLLATKVMVPLDGEIREGIGLLGSPAFEIPRTVRRDAGFELEGRYELSRRLAAKNRHNLGTIGLLLLSGWGYFFVLVLFAMAGVDLFDSLGASAIALASTLILAYYVIYFVLVARAVTPLQTLTPRGCSIYDVEFWRHERFWKLSIPVNLVIMLFNGTPMKNLIWRLLGLRLGKRLFDDGCEIVEKTYLTIGDDVTLNAGSSLQCHSQEDGAFKSDRITIGSGCTLGVGAFVLYGATMGEGSVLEPDSFLMKGEEVPPHERWGGNPARRI